MKIANYETCLTDAQWHLLRRFLPAAKKRGRPRTALRQVINAILYLVKTGAQWRLLTPAMGWRAWTSAPVLCLTGFSEGQGAQERHTSRKISLLSQRFMPISALDCIAERFLAMNCRGLTSDCAPKAWSRIQSDTDTTLSNVHNEFRPNGNGI